MAESVSDLRKKASTLKKRVKAMEDASGIGVVEQAGQDGDRFIYEDKSLRKLLENFEYSPRCKRKRNL